jgi:hypothetical protein
MLLNVRRVNVEMWRSREKRNTYKILVGKHAGKIPFITCRLKCSDITKMSSINTIGRCGLESPGSRYGPVADSFE